MSQNAETQTPTSFITALPKSVYIPRMFNNISVERISNVFHNLALGRVSHVDFVPRDSSSKMAFVHFDHWNIDNIACQHLMQRIHDPTLEARVVYEDPYYWIVLPNNSENNSNSNSFNMRNEMNSMHDTIEHLRSEISSMSNVLDTLLADFYDIPSPDPQNQTDKNKNGVQLIIEEQSNKRFCKVCSVALTSDSTQCSACKAPVDADEKLLEVLTTRPENDSVEAINAAAENATNKIDEFVELNQEKETQNSSSFISSFWS